MQDEIPRFTCSERPALLPLVDSPVFKAQEDTARTIFEQQWPLYRRVVDADYMSHRALFGILHNLLSVRTNPFSFLDLASGDASCSVPALAGTAVASYTAVDLSGQALELAEKNAQSLGCDARLVASDFQAYLETPPQIWDVIFIGFSFHHLVGDNKVSFSNRVRKAVRAGGEWIFFEPILCDESRAGYLERWKECLQKDWTCFTAEEKATIWGHVAEHDYPESPKRFLEIARRAGFAACEHLFTDPYRFYGAFRAVA